MKRSLFIPICLATFLCFFKVKAQIIAVTNLTTTGRFAQCSNVNTSVVVEYIADSSKGTSVVGNSIVCTDPCGSSLIKVSINKLQWNQDPGQEWLHGIFLPANAGYSLIGINLPAGFITFNNGCTGGCPSGTTAGPGFYYDASSGNICCGTNPNFNGYPCDNYGDVSLDCGDLFNMSFFLKFCNSSLTGTTETFALRGTSDGATGCWNTNNGTTHEVKFTINTAPCPTLPAPTIISADTIVETCINGVANFTSLLKGSCGGGTTYWWADSTTNISLGSGSPFVYDPVGSICPAGKTIYMSCCNNSTQCATRVPVTIPNSKPCTLFNINTVNKVDGTCLTANLINSLATNTPAGGYTINPGNISNTTGSFTLPNFGTYTLTASSVLGCTSTSVINFPLPVKPVITTTNVNDSCFNAQKGSITINTISGSVPFSYSLSPNIGTLVGNKYSNLSVGTYTISVIDNGGCTTNFSTSITQPLQLQVTSILTITPNCTPNNNGSITINATGGTTNYSYQLNTGTPQATNSFSNLIAGTYTIKIIDANNCATTSLVVLNSPIPPTASATATNVLCFGSNTGSATAQISNGTAPFVYSWNTSPAQTTLTASALTQGVYTFMVTDAKNCVATTSVSIGQPLQALQIASVFNTIPTCQPGMDAIIVVNKNGGTSPYEYSINNGAYQSSDTFKNLSVGTYTIQIKDANNCLSNSLVNIVNAQLPLINNITTTNVLCFGGNTGSATAQVINGTAPFTYNWNTSPAQTNLTASALTQGVYTFTVTDAKNCVATTSVTIGQPLQALQIANVTTIDPNCTPNNNGSITINATGGTNNYSYQLNSGTPQAINSFSNLIVGTYTVKVLDANNCATTSIVVLNSPIAPTASATATNVLCFGGNTGSATAQVNNGTPPFVYSWNTSPAQTTLTASTLTQGVYTFTVTDAKNCVATTSISITQPLSALIIDSLVTTAPSCVPGNDGTLKIFASGGSINYNYFINNIAAIDSAYNLGSGVYSVSVIDANNCITTKTTSIINSQAPTVIIKSLKNIVCFGDSIGSAAVTVAGGVPPYNYNWNSQPLNNKDSIFGLSSGLYTVSIEDNNACSTSISFNIVQPSQALTIVLDSIKNVTCFNLNNGLIATSVNGGTAPYTYNWLPNTTTTGLAQNLTIGAYNLLVQDANGCNTSFSATISQPSPINWSNLNITPVTINGQSNGSINVQAIGGSPLYNYQLIGTTFNSVNGNGLFNNLNAGNYTLTIIDANNCSKDTVLVITQPNPISLALIDTLNINCYNQSNGFASIKVLGGIAPYTFIFSGSVFVEQNDTILTSNLAAGIYTLQATDANGAIASLTFTITQPNALVINNIVINIPLCLGNTAANATINALGGSGNYLYQLINVTNNQASSFFSSLIGNIYTASVTDANGCKVTSIFNIGSPSPLSINIVSQTEEWCAPNSNANITLAAINGSGIVKFGLSLASILPSNTISNLASGTYTLFAQDAIGCVDSLVTTILHVATIDSINIITNPATCSPGNDGSLSAQAYGGNPNYTYNVNSITNNSGVFNNLAANIYTVNVADIYGCSISKVVAVGTVNSPVINSIIKTNILCNAGNSGAISLAVTGGVLPISYGLTGQVNNTTGVFNNLTANNYTAVVVDGNGCSINTVISLTAPAAIVIDSFNIITPKCNSSNDGAIELYASGGVGQLNYTLNNSTTNLNGNFNSLIGGSAYTITIKDVNTCSKSTIINMVAPNPIQFSSTIINNLFCNKDNSGSINSSVTGGIAPFNFNLNPGNKNNTNGFFNLLSANTYTLTAIDANSCSTTTIATITEPLPVVLSSLNIPTINCFGNFTNVSATASGGVGTLNYFFNALSNTSGQFVNVAAGIYTLTIKDAKNCKIDSILNIMQPNSLLVDTVSVKHINCNGLNNGIINVLAQGGNGGYSYQAGALSNTSGNFTNLTANTYTINVTDNKGCSKSITQTITEPLALVINNVTTTTVSCFNGNDGALNLSVLGGFPNYTYTLLPQNINSTVGNFTNLVSTTYTILAKDNNLCSVTTIINITQPNAILFSPPIVKNITCFGGSDGFVNTSANGGIGNLMYSIDNFATTNNSGAFNNLQAATYTVYVKDSKNCSTSTLVTLSQSSPIKIDSIANILPQCYGLPNGKIFLKASGGKGQLTIKFNNVSYINPITLNNLKAGNYYFEFLDSLGCFKDTSIVLTEPTVINTDPKVLFTNICEGNSLGKVLLNTSGGTLPYSYVVAPSFAIVNNDTLFGLGEGIYTIIVRDANGCSHNNTFIVGLNPNSLNVVNTAQGVTCLSKGNDGSITAAANGGNAPYLYSLNNNGFSTINIFDSLIYDIYTVTVKDAFGCTAKDTITVPFANCCSAFLANSFSPNGDDVNDIYKPISGATYQIIKFAIYNRFGNQVFTTNDEKVGWDGTYKGIPIDYDTYFVIFTYRCYFDNKVYNLKTDLNLLR